MPTLFLRVLAFLLFLLAACNQTVLSQPPGDLVAFGLAAWVAATLLAGYGPPMPVIKRGE